MRLSFPRRLTTVAAAAAVATSSLIAASEAPASAAAPRITKYAFGMHFLNTAHHYPVMPFSSARIFDMSTGWRNLQPTSTTLLDSSNPGVQRLDHIVSLFRSHGVQPLIVLGPTPDWAAESCNSHGNPSTCAPSLRGLSSPWAAYVRFLATRYHNVYFELWNEPNLQSGWNDWISRLAQMQGTAYSVIHNAGTGDRLVSPTAAITATSPNTPANSFLKSFFSKAGGKQFDIFGIHLYPADKPAKYRKGPEWSIQYFRNYIRPVLHNYGISKPVWDTEVNVGRYQYSSAGGCAWGTAYPCLSRSFSGTAGAAMVARIYLTQLSGGVQRVFWYAADDRTWGGTWMETSSYHWLTYAGKAERTLYRLLVRARAYGCSTTSGGAWTCKFHLASGKNMLAKWTTGKAFYTHGPRGTTRRYTVTGGSTSITYRTRLHITSVPQYIVGSFSI